VTLQDSGTLSSVRALGKRALQHSVKALPNAHSAKAARQSLNQQRLSLSSATWKALGKAFAERHVSTGQRLTAGSREALLDSSLPSATMADTQQRLFFFFLEKFFAECHPGWRSAKIIYFFIWNIFCRVPRGWNSAKLGTTATQCPALPSAYTRQSWDFILFFRFLLFFTQFTVDKYDNIHNICDHMRRCLDFRHLILQLAPNLFKF